MPKRESAAEASRPKRKSTPRSKEALDAGRANLAKGRAKKDAERKAAHAAGAEPAPERWAKLLSGSITVADLDDEEIRRGKVRGKDGGFNGSRKAVPSHLVQAFQSEALKRAQEQFRLFAPAAVKRLLEIAEDPDVPAAVQVKALMAALDRGLGRTPETIRIEGASAFDAVTMEALGVDRNMADEA